MALGGTDVLKLIIDADSKGAVSEFDKLGKSIKSSVGDAEKATTGFKGALSNAFDGLQSKSSTVSGLFQKVGVSSEQAAGAITAAIPAAGVAAAGALVAFAAKGVKAFQETALAAGKFADSTGLSVDAASRYIAIADDIGVGAGTIQNAFIKMEKAISGNRQAFGDLVVTGKNGATDLNATFLNVITHLQGIKDPIERANESSKLFGKGFAEVSQIIGTDADTLKKKLDGVSKAQVISQGELQKARDYQAAMDNLKDSVGDLSRNIGGALVPSLTAASNAVAGFVNAVDSIPAGDAILQGGLAGWGQLAKAIKDTYTATVTAGGAIGQIDFSNLQAGSVILGGLSGSTSAFSKAVDETARAHDRATTSADGYANAVGHESDQLADFIAKQDAASAAVLASVDATFAQHKLTLDVTNAQQDLTKAQQDGAATAQELQVKQDNVVASAIALAAKNKEVESSAHGAEAGNNAFIGTLTYIANTSSPEVKAQLQGVIDKLKDTGNQHPNPDVNLTDNATPKIRVVKDGLDGLRGGVTMNVNANVNTGAANAALNALSARLSAAAAAGVQIAGHIGTFPHFAHGGLVGGGAGQAQMAVVHGGEYVLPTDVVKAIQKGQPPGPGALSSASAVSGGGTVVINFSGLVTDEIAVGREIKRVLARAGYSGVN